jgi:hypothetical protein
MDRAVGMCATAGEKSCTLESFPPEKRKKSACTLPGEPPVKLTCYESETYEADRKKNDVTLYGGSGKVPYHIYESW